MKTNSTVFGKYVWRIRIRTPAHLDNWLTDCFGGLLIKHNEDGTSLITGELMDMSAVYGLIIQLRDAGISIISLDVRRKAK